MLPEVKKRQTKGKAAKVKAGSKVKDYGNDPFFVKKAAESKAFLEKHGFPKEILLKK